MRFIDLFAGVGGFHLGLERTNYFEETPSQRDSESRKDSSDSNGEPSTQRRSKSPFSCVWANEWDKHAGEIYQKRFPNTPFFGGDIRSVDVGRIPGFDLLCGGFPCQSFSIAGKRKGFNDTRGTLFFEIARIIKAKRPKIVLLENVRGLLSHEAGRTFGRIIEVLGELGYWVEWEVLNSKNFGVPQNRERVFIIGHLRGESQQQIFPLGQSNGVLKKKLEPKDICPTIMARYYKRGKTDPYIQEGVGLNQIGEITEKIVKRKFDTPKEINEFLRKHKGIFTNKQIAKKLDLSLTQVEHYFRTDSSRAIPSKEVWQMLGGLLLFPNTYDSLVTEMIEKENEFEMNQRVYSSDGVARTLTDSKETGLYAIDFRNNRVMKESPTLLGNDHNTIHRVSDGVKIRRLTPIECERLQGFPDNWTEGLSDTQRYKCMGNAVTVNVVEAIGEKLLKQ